MSTSGATPAARFRLDGQVGFLLRRAYQRASANLARGTARYRVTVPQFAALARLYEHGELSQNLLGRLVAMEPANIRDVVRRLARRGLVATGPAAGDARLVQVSLTAAGRVLAGRLIAIDIACTEQTLAALRPGERRTLCELLLRLAECRG